MTAPITSDNTSHAQWARVERVLAGMTILDGMLGLAVWMVADSASGALALLSLLALFAGTQAWRRRPAGQLAALGFYGLHLATYHAFDFSRSYQLRGALNLGAVIYLPNAVVVLNVFAIAMFAASAAMLWWRVRVGEPLEHTAASA